MTPSGRIKELLSCHHRVLRISAAEVCCRAASFAPLDRGGASVYLFGLTVNLILYFTIGENFVVVAFFNHALMWLLIAALPATVGCLLVFRCRSDR